MDFMDRLALAGRRYESRVSPETGSMRLQLPQVLTMYNGKAIMELTALNTARPSKTVRPDADRKLKVSLLDGLSEIHAPAGGWYEVFETAPSGDLAKVRIVAKDSGGSSTGELRMLVGRRTLDHYFLEDPILRALEDQSKA
jgi:hypothetical protein